MSINQRQFNQLNEMGISLWTSRAQNGQNDLDKQSYISIDLAELSEHQLFKDILQSAGVTIGEVIKQNQHLNLGLFDWYFIDSSEAKDYTISYKNNKLITPSISLIASSPKFKKQLWNEIESHIL